MLGEASTRISTAATFAARCPTTLGWFVGYWAGVIASITDDDESCLREANLVRSVATSGGDRLGLAVAAALTSQALQRMAGRNDEAVSEAAQAVALMDGIDEPVWLGWMLGRLALALQASGDPRTAFAYFRRSEEVRRQAGCELYLTCSLVGLGSISLDLGNFAEAINFYQEAHALALRNGDSWLSFFARLGIAELAAFMAINDHRARPAALLFFGSSNESRHRHGYASAKQSSALLDCWLHPLRPTQPARDLDAKDSDLIERGRMLTSEEADALLDALRDIARDLPNPGIATRSRLPHLAPGLE